MTDQNNPAARVYACPGCKTSIVWDSANPAKPFCSEKCKNQDFIAWANEDHAIPGSPVYEDILSSDLENH
ncbi:DNA gyrase inhibitor YacG [Spongiibacter taiwanensis]|uniref:DNA gyrase inhibitor YacG n=1 Tax=Spongiibacter taiwanensis TaxID=1748242 RepID=UPI00203500DF|nr:DNA gyrase inhibitor YacG [Spongiibacter taiwanensis]USA44266.1 DNA gyrase inhibitor YacG [Spongiibacter taiwanensis]